MSRIILLLPVFILSLGLSAQVNGEDVLFTVGDREVTVGEFNYIYTKTNGDQADFSRASLQEYLDLYERFKLKVNRAYDMGLDTITSLQRELAGYRRQLADNYLIDRAVTDQLVEELYERQQTDVDISHILVSVKPNAAPADTLVAYQQILKIAKGLTPANFAKVAQEKSQDGFSKEKGGRIGYLNAPFPDGLYPLETAVYEAEPGKVVGPLRTNFGYHLALVNERRPARGELEVAHIMTRKPANGNAQKAKQKIDRAYALLEAGQPFEQVATSESEDEKTARNGGYIGFFGINKYAKPFEDAAFGLSEDDAYSKVVESEVGYHIIRRISKKELGTLPEERALLTVKVKKDGRFEAATEALLKTIRRRADLQENQAALSAFAATLADSTFFSFQWQPAAGKAATTKLFTLGEAPQVTYLEEFQQYLVKNARQRVGQRPYGSSATVAQSMYEEFLEQKLMAYAESQLEADYPGFRALMREYEEGILLFEATKIEVWDKAGQDTVGLKKFFNEHREDYRWEDRAQVTLYTIYPNIAAQADAIRQLAEKEGPDAVLQAFQLTEGSNKGVTARTDYYERNRLPQFDELKWEAGTMTPMERNIQNGRFSFYKVEEVLGSALKELDEARGYVIADYQDQLEREWVEALRKEYPVKLRKRTFEKMIRKP